MVRKQIVTKAEQRALESYSSLTMEEKQTVLAWAEDLKTASYNKGVTKGLQALEEYRARLDILRAKSPKKYSLDEESASALQKWFVAVVKEWLEANNTSATKTFKTLDWAVSYWYDISKFKVAGTIEYYNAVFNHLGIVVGTRVKT